MTTFRERRAKVDKDAAEQRGKIRAVKDRMGGCPNCQLSNWGVSMSYPNNDLMADPVYYAYCHECGWDEQTGKVRDKTYEQPNRHERPETWGT